MQHMGFPIFVFFAVMRHIQIIHNIIIIIASPMWHNIVVVEGFLELFTVAQKQMVVKRFDREDLLQLQRTEVMA